MKLGRNDPCHCGSGKKYKFCHYDEDRAKEAAELREAEIARAKAAEEALDSESDDADTEHDDAHDHDHAAARAESTGRPKHGGSRFLRDSSHGGKGNKGATGATGPQAPRISRGAQRGS